ncbi:BgTH12-02145, partial [Blumeria graminis f. sp. triticale]
NVDTAGLPATINHALNDLKRLLSFKERELDANSMEYPMIVCMEKTLQL